MSNKLNRNLQIETNIKNVLKDIRALEQKYQRPENSVQLVAVSKTKPLKDILAANACGQIDFGENYVQEALKKIENLKTINSNLCWHFIGPIQKNKTRLIAEYFQWVHSIDRLIIAKRLNDQHSDLFPPLQVCIQVNIDDEASKAGVTIKNIQPLAEGIKNLKHIKLRGLMAVPRASSETHEQRKSFARLRKQLEQLNQNGFMLDTLSMGMSGDLEAAIAEGSTIVRVGTKSNEPNYAKP
ncbi:MAG: YggS family pyridoxal phosphate-dependent enzyme [Gammaproteobacteria bacterium]